VDGLDLPLSVEDIETLRLRISQIDLSLLAIATMLSVGQIPSPAFLDLWPRIWQWIEFRDTYQDHLPTPLDFKSNVSRYATYMQIFRWFARIPQVGVLITTTPGVYTVVGRAWAHLIDQPGDEGFDDCCKYLGHWFTSNTWAHTVFEELVSGAGGTRHHLASVILAHLKRVIPTPHYDMTEESVIRLMGPLYITRQIMAGDWDVPFRHTLLSRGIITALTSVLCSVGRSTHPIAMLQTKGFLVSLVSGLMSSPAHPRITESLRAGLLPAILSCGSIDTENETTDLLVEVLRDILPGSTVYHSILLQLELSLSEVREVKAETMLARPTLIKLWQCFLTLAENRLRVMKEYDACALSTSRMCGNAIVSGSTSISPISHRRHRKVSSA
jgi:hypothetical protein